MRTQETDQRQQAAQTDPAADTAQAPVRNTTQGPAHRAAGSLQDQNQDLLPQEHAVASLDPGSLGRRRGKVIVLATLGCLTLALAGGLYWFWQFPQEFSLLMSQTGQTGTHSQAARQTQAPPVSAKDTATGVADRQPAPAQGAAPDSPQQTAGQPAGQRAHGAARSAAPDAAAPDGARADDPVAPAQSGQAVQAGQPVPSVQLPALAGFAPGSVYSGTLGEMTRLQAGSQLARADLALKEVQVRLHELEARLQSGTRKDAAGAAQQEQKTELEALQQRLQHSMDRILTALNRQGEEKNLPAHTLAVVAVRGRGGHLEAELRGSLGTFWVREGETVQGLKVDEISRQRVRLNGQILPWR